ncbi:hypothetical protein LWC33_32230 [Pseudonocardia sp. RS11V-5]|uniref:hypothetical protein n=1 Tax=Pseudonocardia terrae TaxID=2905831 RepID=UPI001E5027F1|nr:hypothetical protein [Pseudonocardia terrae]MCE3556097.1 hypothetical protein [Pseudonocardia terrae]
MNVRFTDEETEALRAQAVAEDRSMQDVARAAVREYVERHSHHDRVAEALAVLGPRNKDLLRRLGDA